MNTTDSKKELTNEEIKSEVDKMGMRFWNECIKKSKEMFPENARSAWMFRGRVYQSLYANHFIQIQYPVNESLKEQE